MADETVVPTPTGTPTPGTTPPAAETQPDNTAGRTFTQDEVNRFLAEERKKERARVADYEQLKAAATELAKIKESQLSEQQRLEKRLAELETAKTQAETRARETLIQSAVLAEAAKLNFWNPEQVYKLIDLSSVKVADNGQVEGAVEAVKTLAENQKYLIKSQTGRPLEPFDPAAQGGQLKETDAQRRARLYSGGGQQFFNADTAPLHGGGLVWPKGKPE